jgi:hypothetical protein
VNDEWTWEPFSADGIATIRYKRNAVVTEDMARQTLLEFATLAGSRRLVLLADLRNVKSITREARVAYGNAAERYGGLALLAGSLSTQVIANFFIGLSRPKVPTQMFTDEQKALTWLRRYTA